MPNKKNRLTVFLIKEDFQRIDDFVELRGFTRLPIPQQEENEAMMAYKTGFPKKPEWADIFSEVEGFDPNVLINTSTRAIYVVKVSERWFCFTFGYARHVLKEGTVERNFGLRVSLNMCDPESIRGIDKTSFGHVSLRSKEQATRDIEISGFEFEYDIDLLKSLTGYKFETNSEDKEIFSGRDSVTIHTRSELQDFPEIAQRLFEAYSDDRYKELYPWVDNIVEERDPDIVQELWGRTCELIRNNEFENVWLAIPDVVDWDRFGGFQFNRERPRQGNSQPVHHDIDIRNWVSTLRTNQEITESFLKRDQICLLDLNDQLIEKWSVKRCLNAEVDHNGIKYILNDGEWYQVDPDFVSSIDRFFADTPYAELDLPRHEENKESVYLESVADDNNIVLMDRRNISIGGGRSKVEFCDLYMPEGIIIHVKKYGGSSLLGHLFNQAMVSAESFLNDFSFRQQVNEELPDHINVPEEQSEVRASDYSVVMAIMSNQPGDLHIPFFSKVVFRHVVRAISNMGFRVYKEKIPQ